MLIQLLANLCNLPETDSVRRPSFTTKGAQRQHERIVHRRDLACGPKRLLKRDILVDDSSDPFAALDRSIADTARRTRLETRVYRRARALMRENGLAHGYSEEKALQQATLEITGALARR